jgi:hypothetical protein
VRPPSTSAGSHGDPGTAMRCAPALPGSFGGESPGIEIAGRAAARRGCEVAPERPSLAVGQWNREPRSGRPACGRPPRTPGRRRSQGLRNFALSRRPSEPVPDRRRRAPGRSAGSAHEACREAERPLCALALVYDCRSGRSGFGHRFHQDDREAGRRR